MLVASVWAQANGGAIGRDGGMPWHLPEDLAHFKAVTLGHPVIMGRLTWESLPEKFRPLPGRDNVVVSRNPDYVAEGATVLGSFEAALRWCEDRGAERVSNIGGGHLFLAGLPLTDELLVTRIDLDVADADTFAPEIGAEWELADGGAPEISKTGLTYRFERYVRH